MYQTRYSFLYESLSYLFSVIYLQKNDEETTAVRERIISIRKKVHSQTVDAVSARWNYEEGVSPNFSHFMQT